MEKPIVINYGDSTSTAALWWKSFLMAPPWGFALLPVLGLILQFFGDSAAHCGYFLVLAAFFAYFIKDMLERKIKIAKGVLRHGFDSYELSSLLSLGTSYKRKKSLPSAMVFTFRSGRSLTLQLDRVSFADYEQLLRLVESKYPHCHVDPVLTALVKCKRVARKVLVRDPEKLIVQYDSQKLFKQLIDTFFETAQPWLRVGPIFVAVISLPVWLGATSSCFFLGAEWNAKSAGVDLLKAGFELGRNIDSTLAWLAGGAAFGLGQTAENPAFFVLMFSLMGAIVYSALRFALRPNVLTLDAKGMSVNFVAGNFIVPITKVLWQDVLRVSLDSNRGAGGNETRIRFESKSGPATEIDYAAVLAADRPAFMQTLERLAPNCSVDSELSEAMLPKQERSYTEVWLQSLSASPERNSIQPLAPGQGLLDGRYVVMRRLGVGGQGTAYLCKDAFLGTEVVLKETIIPVFANHAVKDQALKRFEHEAAMLRGLASSKIVAMHDYFFEDHRGYLVLEHVEGENLRQVVSHRGAMSEESVRDLAKQMCEILAYLHERSIIHRDFTPDNLMLTNDGRIKLIDFNVAQMAQVGATGTIAGKHAYLPPEQFRGKATLQSDIYALGATLYYLLTGKDPEAITASSPREKNERVSIDLDAIVRSCTALKLDQRCQTVADLQEKLALVQSPLPAVGTGSRPQGDDEESIVISLRQTEFEQQEA